MATTKNKANSNAGTAAIAQHIVDETAKRAAAKKPVAKKTAVKKAPAVKKPVAKDTPQDAAVVTRRTSAKKSVEQGKVVNGVPAALIEKPVKGRKEAKQKLFDEKVAKAPAPVVDPKQPKLPNSGISGAHAPAKKVAAKKSTAVKSRKPSSPSATTAPNSSTQSTSSSAPSTAKVDPSLATAPGTENTDKVTAEIKELLARAQEGGAHLTRHDISRVVKHEVNGNITSRECSIHPMNFTKVIGEAFQRADDTLQKFRVRDRSAIRPFIVFFERFWGVIENRQDIGRIFNRDAFMQFVAEECPSLLEHGEYVRYTFTCGTRVVLQHTFAGSVFMVVEANEFVAQLKGMPLSDAATIEEQEKKNPYEFHFVPVLPHALSALVRCDIDQPGLSLMVLNRVFGDPIEYMLHQIENNLATQVEDTLDFLVDAEAAGARRPKAA
jgi:hypothetical protein